MHSLPIYFLGWNHWTNPKQETTQQFKRSSLSKAHALMSVFVVAGKLAWKNQYNVGTTNPVTSCWLNQPIWKICAVVKLDHLPNFRGENSKNLWVATTWRLSPYTSKHLLRRYLNSPKHLLRFGCWGFQTPSHQLFGGFWMSRVSRGRSNSTYRGEITPVKPIYFRPFIEATTPFTV